MDITIRLDGKPKGKDRPRFSRGFVYTPKKTLEYENMIKETFIENAPKNFRVIEKDVPIKLDVVVNQKKGKQSKKTYPTLKPDIDNILKIIMDGLNGVCYQDDSQVINVKIHRVFSDDNYITVRLQSIN